MKTSSVTFAAAALVVLSSAIGCGKSDRDGSFDIGPTPITLTLSGRVVDAAMGDESGVAEAVVTATREQFSASAMTDAEGNFSITGLDAGEYMVSVSREGFLESQTAVQLEASQAITVYIDRESDGSIPAPERKARVVLGKKGAQVRR